MSGRPAKVPQIIQELSEATRRDIAPAARLMSRIFVGTLLGGEGSFVREVASAAAKAASPAGGASAPKPKRPPSRARSSVHAGAIVVDAEIVEDETCSTCGGSRKVGRAGHEVRCPVCK